MTVRHPPADVIGQTHVAVVASRQGGQIERLPTAIVCESVRPAWVIADMESPGASSRVAAARSVGGSGRPPRARSAITIASVVSVATMMPTIHLRWVASIGAVVEGVVLGIFRCRTGYHLKL